MVAFRRSDGLPMAMMCGVGPIVDPGIDAVLAQAVAEIGESIAVSFVRAGTVVLLTGLHYAELASRDPSSGTSTRRAGTSSSRRLPPGFAF